MEPLAIALRDARVAAIEASGAITRWTDHVSLDSEFSFYVRVVVKSISTRSVRCLPCFSVKACCL